MTEQSEEIEVYLNVPSMSRKRLRQFMTDNPDLHLQLREFADTFRERVKTHPPRDPVPEGVLGFIKKAIQL